MELRSARKSWLNWEYAAKFFILVVATLGVSSVIGVLALITFSTPFLKVLIGAVGVVLIVVSALGWKMVTMSFEPVVQLPHPVLLHSCAYDFSHFAPTPFRPVRMEAPFSIPRPIVSPDPNGPPTRLAPPPPTYDFSQTVSTSTAPPPYSVNGVLRRTSSNSPPPGYNTDIAINSPPPQRSRRVVIDCSKAEPALFSIAGAESVI